MKKTGRILSAVLASAALLMQLFPGYIFADKEKTVIDLPMLKLRQENPFL